MVSDRLSPQGRAAALDALDATATGEPVDVLVIGGGITGAGTVLDAATRGLTTAIVEIDDWASGTSSRSSNLVHGGLRYLEMLDFKLVWEALHERDILLSTASHLVRPQSFLFPLKHRFWQRVFIGAGIFLYDVMASVRRGKRLLPWHRHLSRTSTRKRFPSLSKSAFVGAIEYWDATVDDAALVVSLVRTACRHGALAVSRVQVVGLTSDGSGAVNGARMVDLETGRTITVRARHVISSTGVWTEETEAMARTDVGIEVLASKGAHIAVRRDRIEGDAALILQTPTSVLFAIPSHNAWVIGTTDTPWEGDRRHPVATGSDIDYLIEQVNSVLVEPISRDDVIGTWAGLRPLLQPAGDFGESPSKVSREHTVVGPVPGLTIVAGGKLTTYRVMAEDAVDLALGSQSTARPSRTKTVPITGAEDLGSMRRVSAEWQSEFDWDSDLVTRLIRRYGDRMPELLAACRSELSMARPLASAPSHIRAEIAHAVTHEGALDLEDVLRRRTRIDREYPRHGIDTLDEVANIIGPLLGWTRHQLDLSIESYRTLAEAEMAAAMSPNDGAAAQVMSDIDGPPLWPFLG